jgi:regulator of sigma E protease
MISALQMIGGFVVAVCVLVAIHELGHYSVARLFSVRVLRFSIGFGKPFYRRLARNGTEFVVAWIPLGGYVKMLDEREGPVPEAERPYAFNRQSVGKRAAVLVAGPLFNLVFAVVAYWAVFVAGVPGVKPILGEVGAASYAERAGLREHDEILEIGGRTTATWEGALLALLDELLDDGHIAMQVRGEDGATRSAIMEVPPEEVEALTEPGELLTGLGLSAWSPPWPPRLGEVTEGGAASAAGLRAGDLVRSADGVAMPDWETWREYVRARPGQTIELEIERDGAVIELPLTVGETEEEGERFGRIDAAAERPDFDELRAEQRYPVLEALRVAAVKTWDMSALTLRMFWKMLWGEVSVRNISGPINIAEFAGYSASGGVVPFLTFLAIVSISLGLINLMPIPLLDGGQLLYAGIEVVRGTPLSQRAEEIGQQLGVALLLVLMSVAFYNDISRLVN